MQKGFYAELFSAYMARKALSWLFDIPRVPSSRSRHHNKLLDYNISKVTVLFALGIALGVDIAWPKKGQKIRYTIALRLPFNP